MRLLYFYTIATYNSELLTNNYPECVNGGFDTCDKIYYLEYILITESNILTDYSTYMYDYEISAKYVTLTCRRNKFRFPHKKIEIKPKEQELVVYSIHIWKPIPIAVIKI